MPKLNACGANIDSHMSNFVDGSFFRYLINVSRTDICFFVALTNRAHRKSTLKPKMNSYGANIDSHMSNFVVGSFFRCLINVSRTDICFLVALKN